MNGRNFTPEEHFLVRRMFNSGATDSEIAEALVKKYQRQCKSEAVRKVRRQLGLKKVALFERWKWGPFLHA
jgi:hypothetical protein